MRQTYLILFSIILFSSSVSFAQNNSLKGRIIDSLTKKPVDFATVILLQQIDKKRINGAQTAQNGSFSFSAIPKGKYLLRIGFVGYASLEKEISMTTNQVLDLADLRLRPSKTNVLKEVVIQGRPPDMQMGIDRKIFDVSQSIVSEGGSATDLLANVPSLSVDVDGTVSLRGSSSVRILIDGKPSAMAGSDINQVLQSLPANSIQTIEVVTNPSSKYDAEGQSGIINIILKKNIRTGLNGIVSISGGSYDNYNGGVSLNYRDKSFNYFGNYNLRKSNRLGNGFNSTRYLANDGLIANTSENQRKGLSHTVKAGIDYYMNDQTTLGFSGNISIRKNDDLEKLIYQYDNLPDLTGSSNRYTKEVEDDTGYDLNLDFKRTAKRKGEELTANAAFGSGYEHEIQTFNQDFSNPSTPVDQRLNNTTEDGKNINLQLDYVLPFTEEKRLETGYRSTFRNSDESQLSDRFNPETGTFQRDYMLSNNFEMDQSVHAIYANYKSKLIGKLSFQAGFRAEEATLNTSFISVDPSVPVNERNIPGKLNYFRIYPSVFLMQKLANQEQLQLSYTRRVSRPSGWQVNPFMDVSDPLNIRQGNPNLLPEDIHSFEFAYSRSWEAITFTSSVYYRQVNDVVESITRTIDQNTAATLSQWQNISRNQTSGIELIARLKLNDAIDVTSNVNLFYSRFSGSKEFNIEATDGYTWNTNLMSNIRFSKNLSLQMRAEYNAPRVMAQGRSIENFVLDGGVKMNVLNNKGSLLFNVRDIFNKRRFGGYTQTEQFIQNFQRRQSRRIAQITFSYRFGSQQIKTDDDQKDLEEDNSSN